MLYAGKNMMDPTDKLSKISIDYLFRCLKSPKPNITAQLRQLNAIREIDPKRYEQMKRRLPYFTTSCFKPLVRNIRNFAYSEYFILDIDELSAKGLNANDMKAALINDSRILMMFTSQGGDGLKLLFKLEDKCYDEGIYTVFVKEFAQRFYRQYNIEQFVDSQRSDVTYTCYISTDEEPYYNTEAIPIVVADIIDTDNPLSFFDMKAKQEEEEKLHRKALAQKDIEEDNSIQEEELSHIKGILMGERYTKRLTKHIYKPKELEAIMPQLVAFIQDQGIEVYEVHNLDYAKKLRCKRGSELAELNIFLGANGYSVIQTPRCCTSDELNDAVSEIIKVFIASLK